MKSVLYREDNKMNEAILKYNSAVALIEQVCEMYIARAKIGLPSENINIIRDQVAILKSHRCNESK